MAATPTRYSTFFIILHWGTALLLLYLLTIGHEPLEHTPNSDPAKVDILRNHFLLGGLAILLTVIRMAMKRLTAIPPTAATGNSLIDRAALLGHLALYGIVLLIGISGLVTALQSGALQTVFGAGGALPPNFHAYFSVEMHELFGNLLMALVALHVVAALYHQFIVRDGLFRRMWFGAGSK